MTAIARFDGAAMWATLTAERRDAIGALALELLCAQHAQEVETAESPVEQTPRARAADAAEQQANETLLAYVMTELPADVFAAPDGSPLIPSIVGPICRACGCTQEDACPEGCGWAEPDLCTACVGAEP